MTASPSELPELPDLAKLPHIARLVEGAGAEPAGGRNGTALFIMQCLLGDAGWSPHDTVAVLQHYAARCALPYEELDRLVFGVLGKGIELASDDFIGRGMLGALFADATGQRSEPPVLFDHPLVALARAHVALCQLDDKREGPHSFTVAFAFSFGVGAAHVRKREWTVRAAITPGAQLLDREIDSSGDKNEIHDAMVALAGKLRQRGASMQADLDQQVQRLGERRKAVDEQLAPLFAGGVD